jgi:hypothetical protein
MAAAIMGSSTKWRLDRQTVSQCGVGFDDVARKMEERTLKGGTQLETMCCLEL